MAGGGIPFHGAAETWIKVGLAGRDKSEFQGAAGDLLRGDLAFGEEGVGLGVAVGSANRDHQAFKGRGAGTDGLGGGAVPLHVRGVRGIAEVRDSDGGGVDDAQHRLARSDQCDIDGELAIAADELLGTVQGVDEPEAATADLGQPPGGYALLGDDGDARRQGFQRLDDEPLGGLVGFGDRRGIRLRTYREIATVDAHDHLARPLGDAANLVDDPFRRLHGPVTYTVGRVKGSREGAPARPRREARPIALVVRSGEFVYAAAMGVHPYIAKLKGNFAERWVDRREFLRTATLLGLSAGAAVGFAAKVKGESVYTAVNAALPRGGDLRRSMRVLDLKHPHAYSWIYDSNVARQVCEYLTVTDHNNITRPYLLRSWEASPDLSPSWHFFRPVEPMRADFVSLNH